MSELNYVRANVWDTWDDGDEPVPVVRLHTRGCGCCAATDDIKDPREAVDALTRVIQRQLEEVAQTQKLLLHIQSTNTISEPPDETQTR